MAACCCDEPLDGAVLPGSPTGGGVATPASEDVSPYVCKQMQQVRFSFEPLKVAPWLGDQKEVYAGSILELSYCQCNVILMPANMLLCA